MSIKCLEFEKREKSVSLTSKKAKKLFPIKTKSIASLPESFRKSNFKFFGRSFTKCCRYFFIYCVHSFFTPAAFHFSTKLAGGAGGGGLGNLNTTFTVS